MEEQPGLSSEYRTASPWPLFVALGFALSEVGIFLGVFPVAVGGVLLFGGSVAGILTESGYVTQPWQTLGVLGVAFAAIGAAIIWTGVGDTASLTAIVAEPTGVTGRGLAVMVAGVMLVAAGGTGRLMGPTAPTAAR
jgi:hypothetical protein